MLQWKAIWQKLLRVALYMAFWSSFTVLATLQKQVGCFNYRVVTLVVYKLERQWGVKINCMRQPERQLPNSSYNHNTLNLADNPQNICEGVITNALQSCYKELSCS